MAITDELQPESNDLIQTDPTKAKPCVTLYELMEKKLATRDRKDRIFFDHSVQGLSGLCVIGSLYMNVVVRKSLWVYESLIVTSVGISAFSSTTTYLTQSGLVQWPLMEGELTCRTCAIMRGSVLQGINACILPGCASFLLSAIAADSFKTTKIPVWTFPPTKEFRSFWGKIAGTIKRRSAYMLVFQLLAGGIIANRQYEIVSKMRSTITPEEKMDVWRDVLCKMDESF